MKTLILLISIFSFQVFAEVENEPITAKQFDEMQEKQVKDEQKKAEKVPALIGSHMFINEKEAVKMVKNKYRAVMMGDQIIGLTGTIKSCSFNFLKVGEAVNGHYWIESSSSAICQRVRDMEGQDTASVTLILEFTDLADIDNGTGGTKVIPIFNALSID